MMTTQIHSRKGKVVYIVNPRTLFNYIDEQLPQQQGQRIDISRFFPQGKITSYFWRLLKRRFSAAGWLIRQVEYEGKLCVVVTPDREDKEIRKNGPV